MSQYCIYLKMPSYLRQWFINRHGGSEPVSLLPKSVESKVLQLATVKMPENIIPPRQQEGEVAICIPFNRHHDPRTYNYITETGKHAMLDMIKNSFDVELWNYVHDLGKLTRNEKKNIINLFMEQHGIKEDGKCWDAIVKIYDRQRNIYLTNENRKNRKN